MQNLTPPAPLQLDGNRGEKWRKWKRRWELFYVASGLKNESDEVRTATFLTVIGEEANDIFDTFKWSQNEDKEKLTDVIAKFEEYFLPKSNVTLDRHVFNTRNQKADESVEDYMNVLKHLVKECKYGDLTESIIKDRLIAGIRDEKLKVRLLEKPDADLDQTMNTIRAIEASKSHMNVFAANFQTEKSLNVDAIKTHSGSRYKGHKNQGYRKDYLQGKQKAFHKPKYQQKPKQSCGYCGRHHGPKSCPAFGVRCHKCNKQNHFAKVCRFKNGNDKHVSVVGAEQSSDDDEENNVFFIGAVLQDQANTHKLDWHETLIINNAEIPFKLDTGAQCNVMPKQIYQKLSSKPLHKTKVKLKSYTNDILHPIGQTLLICKWKGTKYRINFQVVEGNYAAILGKETLEKMRMIIRNVQTIQADMNKSNCKRQDKETIDILDDYPELFEGLGKLPGVYQLRLEDSIKPVVHPPRNIPHSLKQKAKHELEKMVTQGIIEKVPHNEPSEWVHSIVTVAKPNGEVRICLDPRDLNIGIKREHHPIITVEDIAAKVEKAKFFTLLDARSAFHQIELHKDSSKLLTFNTPFGRFRYLRMPMGIKSATEVYQRRIQDILEGIDGVEAGIDDILIWGNTEEEHDIRIRQVLQRLKENNLKLKREKCKVKQKELKFHGHIFTSTGLKPDKTKCQAIREMPMPSKKEDVKCFLGMITYVGKFIPNLSQRTAPLRELLHKNVEWNWTSNHTECFKSLQNALISPPVLKYYDPKVPLILQVDASSRGVGAALIQDNQPIAFASRALTETEQSYAQIEKEMLAIVYGCTKFENFLIGREVTIESDHKPLEIITKKPLFKAPPRLQRMLIQLQKYPGIDVTYKKGSQIQIADALSRAYSQEYKEEVEDFTVHALQQVPISDAKIAAIKSEINTDPEMAALKKTILNGWADTKSKIPQILHDYWNIRDELTIVDDVIFKGERLVIPKSFRKEILRKLHESHLGIIKTKQRAREIMYWPRLNVDIETIVKSCNSCAEQQRINSKESMIAHEIPERPWAKVASDLFQLNGKHYIICVDFYSKYPEVSLLQSTSSNAVIISLKSIFARHGIPDTLFTDNGPQYSSWEFKMFSKQWDFEHKTSSPVYPQSNGQAERMVQTIKNILKKASDPYIALLEYRNTPFETVEASPAQLLMSRQLRSILPVSSKMLIPKVQEEAQHKLKQRQQTQKAIYDNNCKTLPELDVGQPIRFRQGIWKKAIVREKLPYRSYVIENENQQIYRRNRRDLRSDTTAETTETNKNLTLSRPINQECNMNSSAESEGRPKTQVRFTPEESTERPLQKTRTGRIIKQPMRLDL